MATTSARPRLATVWLGGCSGCHMSFLDLDERLIELAQQVDLVYSPIVDAKEFPEGVDITLVEGSVASDEHRAMIEKVRQRTRVLVAFGDCAVNGNVTALRNPLGSAEVVLKRSYLEGGDLQPQLPRALHIVPVLLDRVVPLHHVVQVDVWLPGCPPSADLIAFAVGELLAGRKPDLTGRLKFG